MTNPPSAPTGHEPTTHASSRSDKTTITTGQSLAATTLGTLRAFFDAKGHRLSEAHWTALQHVADLMQDMANGRAPEKVFLSPVDPGVGKTQTVLHFARALIASADHRDEGMIICVGRLAEAKNLAEALAGQRDTVAVLTSDDAVNALGGASADSGQVLITTQQRIERATEGRTFAEVSSFHYRGRPRAVRVWDEAWLPGITVTLTSDDLLLLVKPFRRMSETLANGVHEFALRVSSTRSGTLIDVPDFTAIGDAGRSIYDVEGLNDEQEGIKKGLIIMSGRRVRVMSDKPYGNTLLTFKDTFPADMAPFLILDASGRVRHTYQDIEVHRGTLVRLPAAVRDYTPLRVHVWNKGGGKDAWQRNGDVMIDAIADTINSRPDEGWLVVAHKKSIRIPDIEKRVRAKLSDAARELAHFITWGNHMATNAYADKPNLILAGTLFMRPSSNTALTHLSQGRSTDKELVTVSEVADTSRGEQRHLILQAVCRGRVRRSDGERCQPMNAYIIASDRSGIRDDLDQVFPGCQVSDWKPVKEELTGKVKLAADFLRQELAEGVDRIPFTKVQEALSVDRRNFSRLVTSRPAWVCVMDELGLETYGTEKRALGVVRCHPDLFAPVGPSGPTADVIIGPYTCSAQVMTLGSGCPVTITVRPEVGAAAAAQN